MAMLGDDGDDEEEQDDEEDEEGSDDDEEDEEAGNDITGVTSTAAKQELGQTSPRGLR